jgi:hypothetical protein
LFKVKRLLKGVLGADEGLKIAWIALYKWRFREQKALVYKHKKPSPKDA